jgi:HAE1 family hydrophobic/amphiphilic exporter-1
MSVVRKSIDRPVTILTVYILICGLAVVFLPKLSISLFPNTDMPMISVNTTYSGASPEEVEQNVTKVLENALSSVQGLNKMTSTSKQDESSITLDFNYGENLDHAQYLVDSVVNGVLSSLPSGAKTPRIQRFSSSSIPIMTLSVKGNRPFKELQKIGEDTIKPQLERINGVASANVIGGSSSIIAINVSQNRLAAYGMTVTDVAKALASQNILVSEGNIVRGDTQYQITTNETLSSIDQVKNLAIKTVKTGDSLRNKIIYVKDIADVKDSEKDPAIIVYVNGQKGINIQILKESGSNAVQISRQIHSSLGSINRSLPSGVELNILSDDTTLVDSTLSEVYNSAWQGILLSMLVLFLYLRNLKATFIIGISIPISILITLLLMYFAGITLNTISLTGLIMGLGMVVDASIVIIDNIYRYRERGTKPKIAAILGSQEMVVAITASTLTTLCVFIPIILFRNSLGMMGQIFTDLVFTICFSLAVSLIVAVTIVPVLSGPVMRLNTRVQKPLKNPLLKKVDHTLERFFSAQDRAYKKAIEFCLHNRVLVVGLAAGILVMSLLSLNSFGLNLFPQSNANDNISINITLPLGSTIEYTQKVLESLQSEVKSKIKGFRSLVLVAGGNGSLYGNNYNNEGYLQILLPEPGHQIDTPTSIKEKLTKYLGELPGISYSFSSGRQMSSSSALDVEIRSKDQVASLAAAQDIKRLVADNLHDIENLSISLEEGSPEILVQINREKAAAFGFSVSEIANELRGAVYGVTATTYNSSGDLIDVVVRLRAQDRKTLSDIKSLFLINSSGEKIPVSNFVSVVDSTVPQEINRENKERIIHVTGDLKANAKMAATEIARKVQTLIDEKYTPRENVTVSLGGENMDVKTYLPVFVTIILLAIFLVYGVMASQFESFLDPFIILITVPLMFTGVVLIYKVTNDSMSLFSLIGVVTLAGVVVNNSIVLVDYTNTLRARGTPLFEACSEAGRHRLRPIMMSTLTTIFGIMPLALFPGSGTETIQPIAKTMFGGLSVNFIMTLLVTPVLYYMFNSRRERKNAKIAREIGAPNNAGNFTCADIDKEPQNGAN